MSIIDQMHELADACGGECLSDIYINNATKLQWECSEGHQWKASSVNVRLRGRWCPTCK